ncbi:MAG: YigZ family protein [Lachnospiraceae bacterium]|nr:YigZ family protein [Lachnospiraceae bacterium]
MEENRLPASYRSVRTFAAAEIIEKKSRFIGEIFPAATEEEAQERIAAVRKQYHDARHHCFAFVCGVRGELLRSSDDGEPQGTAGKPILAVLTGAALTNTLIVVTRYFGGTLLGTGGLTRAYTQAAQAALSAAVIDTHTFGRDLTVTVSYALSGAVERHLRSADVILETPIYENDVRFTVFVPVAHADALVNDLTNICSGNIDISLREPRYG